MTRKKKIILLSVLVSLALIFCIVFYLSFTVGSFEVVEQLSPGEVESVTCFKRAKIKQDSHVPVRKSLIFYINKDKIKENIERVNPDIKVKAIEKKFPNIIYCSIKPRKGLLKIKVDGEADKALVVDEELFVIDAVSYSSTDEKYKNLILVKGSSVSREEYDSGSIVGHKLKKMDESANVSNIVYAYLNFDKATDNKISYPSFTKYKLLNFIDRIEIDSKTKDYLVYTNTAIRFRLPYVKDKNLLMQAAVYSYGEFKGVWNKAKTLDNNKIDYDSILGSDNSEIYFDNSEGSKGWRIKSY